MLLKNYYQLLSDISQLYETKGVITLPTSIKNLSGQTFILRYSPYNDATSIPIAFPNTFENCIVGSSNDSGDFDDYCLKSQIADFSTSFVMTIPSEVKDGYERFTVIIQGKITADCVIREVGLTKQLRAEPDGFQECLMLRHVLDTPVELQAGDNFNIAISYET